MTAALEGVSGQQHAPAALSPRERPGTHLTGGWVDRSGRAEILVSTGIRSRTVQHVANHYILLNHQVIDTTHQYNISQYLKGLLQWVKLIHSSSSGSTKYVPNFLPEYDHLKFETHCSDMLVLIERDCNNIRVHLLVILWHKFEFGLI